MVEPPRASVAWPRAFRIIATRFPAVELWEGLPPEYWDRLDRIEALTNPRPLDSPRSSYVQWPFSNPRPGRFSTPVLGAFYAAQTEAAAIAETVHYQAIRCREDRLDPHEFDMRVLAARIEGAFHDVREGYPELLDPGSHAASQALATALADRGSQGILFPSVRDADHGACVAAFTPTVVRSCGHLRYLAYRWTGERVDVVYEKRPLKGR